VSGFKLNSTARQNDTSVLVVDNDSKVVRPILQILAKKGIRGNWADNQKTALGILERCQCDLVFISEYVPRRSQSGNEKNNNHSDCRYDISSRLNSGFEMLDKIRTNFPELPVVMISGGSFENAFGRSVTDNENKQGTVDPILLQTIASAVEAVHRGCYDFLIKPIQQQKLKSLLEAILPNHHICTIDEELENTRYLYRIVGSSSKLLHTVQLAERAAPTTVPVLISGESGTGKELISYLLHRKSRRSQGPYVKINCAALSDSLVESELFGHEKGAFTGAYNQRKGRFEIAHGGTLLLDEITETPPTFQAKLLRVLEQQDFERVGGNDNIRVNVRIISTTNKSLLREVKRGRFREDLYYRLCAVRLFIAPLRERREDMTELVWYFVNLYAGEARRRITRLDPLMIDMFEKYRWPGNVRQLRNVVRTSLIMGTGETLSLDDLSWLFDEEGVPEDLENFEDADISPPDEDNISSRNSNSSTIRRLTFDSGLGGVPLEQIERQAILDTLTQTDGNQTKAAKALGISDRTLRGKVRRYREQGCLQVNR